MRREPMTATITHVTHDLAKKQTFVGIAWEAERKLFLPIPWEPIGEHRGGSRKLLKSTRQKMDKTTLKMPGLVAANS
jgi:hypothetical protein